jgi:hypothetical protein
MANNLETLKFGRRMQTEVKDNLAVSHLNPNMTMKTINL